MQSRRSVAAISLLLALCLSDNSLAAGPVPYPQCAMEASTTPLDSVIHLYAGGSGTDRMDVRSVPIRAEGRSRITIDILRYVRKVQDAEGATLQLVIGVPGLDGVLTVEVDPTSAEIQFGHVATKSRPTGDPDDTLGE